MKNGRNVVIWQSPKCGNRTNSPNIVYIRYNMPDAWPTRWIIWNQIGLTGVIICVSVTVTWPSVILCAGIYRVCTCCRVRVCMCMCMCVCQGKGGPEDSRKLWFTDFMKTAQDGGKFVSLTHRPPLPPVNTLGTHLLEAESTPGP
jgi:hypothetical protein